MAIFDISIGTKPPSGFDIEIGTNLGGPVVLEGEDLAQSSETGALAIREQIIGDNSSASSETGDLHLVEGITGADESDSSNTGNITIGIALVGDNSGTGSETGTIGGGVAMVGDNAATSSETGNIGLIAAITGDDSSASSEGGELAIGIALVGDDETDSSETGDLAFGTIAGIATGCDGLPIEDVTCKLFRALDDIKIDETTTDGAGAYSFTVDNPGGLYYVVAFKITDGIAAVTQPILVAV